MNTACGTIIVIWVKTQQQRLTLLYSSFLQNQTNVDAPKDAQIKVIGKTFKIEVSSFVGIKVHVLQISNKFHSINKLYKIRSIQGKS